MGWESEDPPRPFGKLCKYKNIEITDTKITKYIIKRKDKKLNIMRRAEYRDLVSQFKNKSIDNHCKELSFLK